MSLHGKIHYVVLIDKMVFPQTFCCILSAANVKWETSVGVA